MCDDYLIEAINKVIRRLNLKVGRFQVSFGFHDFRELGTLPIRFQPT